MVFVLVMVIGKTVITMGYNTTIVVMNDALGYIEKDIEFGARLATAVTRGIENVAACAPDRIYGNAAIVVETHHMDSVVSVDVGGNTAVVVGSRYDPDFPGPADQKTHECHACGRKHAGYEEKYCDICGKAAQERKTLYEALHMIDIALRDHLDAASPVV
jgi:ribosomal protein L37E